MNLQNGWELKEPARFALRNVPFELPSEVRSELEELIEESEEPVTRGQMLATMSAMLDGKSESTIDSAWWAQMGERESDFPLLGSRGGIAQIWQAIWVFDRRWAVHLALEMLVEREWGGQASNAILPINEQVKDDYLVAREWCRSRSGETLEHMRQVEKRPPNLRLLTGSLDQITRAILFKSTLSNGKKIMSDPIGAFIWDGLYVPSFELRGAVTRSCTALGTGKILWLSTNGTRTYSREEQLEWD